VGNSAEVFFSDDIIFGKGKKGTFQLLVYLKNVDELSAAHETLSGIENISKGGLYYAEVTYIIEDFDIESETIKEGSTSIYCLATAEEFAGSPLCRGRPDPEYYDPFYLAKTLGGSKFVLVRPDRFIYAACDGVIQLEKVIFDAVAYLYG
jgi:hypothetical protein